MKRTYLLAAQGSWGKSESTQQCIFDSTLAKTHASSMGDASQAGVPWAGSYNSPLCNDRIAKESFSQVEASNFLSSKHLQVPENAITQNTIQVMPHFIQVAMLINEECSSRLVGCNNREPQLIDWCAGVQGQRRTDSARFEQQHSRRGPFEHLCRCSTSRASRCGCV